MSTISKAAYIFPGQGSQFAGMGRDLYLVFASARAVFEEADTALGFALSSLCFEGPEEELAKTVNAQPALATVSFACLKAAQEAGVLPLPSFVAGHSLGEYTALAAADILDFSDVVRLAHERGRLMYEVGQQKPGGMLAVLGIEADTAAQICRQSGTWVANFNCPGQVVISGEKIKLEQAAGLAQAAGASRVVPLAVSGAFHTPLMAAVVDGMTKALAALSFRPAAVPLLANSTAQPVSNPAQVRAELLQQLTSAVQWQRSVEYMLAEGVNLFIEIGPKRVLSGLVKRISKTATARNVGDVADIQNFNRG
jgi:[acyl-carrier-protein] S-malonyltransferase